MMSRRAPAFCIAALSVFAACVPATTPRSPAPVAGGHPGYAIPEPDLLGEEVALVGTAIAPSRRDILGSVAYDLPVVGNTWVEAELDFLVGQRRDVIARWLARGDYYEGFVQQVLQDNGVPTDLVHLAMIESGFVPTARSHAGALGIWQFMPATARESGLRVEAEVDERMDPVRSTRAAARHLRSLHRSLGDWSLAAAAYNAGSGRLSRAMTAVGTRDFWTLAERSDLAVETKQYVPRLYAMTVIGRDRERFGLQRMTSTAFAFDSIHVEIATPLAELARLGDLSITDLTQLNPHLVQGRTPANGYWVWVPAGQGEALQRAWLASSFRRNQEVAPRTALRPARSDEPVVAVNAAPAAAGSNGASRPAAASPAASTARATPARAAAPATRPAAAGAAVAAAAPTPARAASTRATPPEPTHTVAAGENLTGIARRYGTTVTELQKTNNLSSSVIRPGQSLRIPSSATNRPPRMAEHVVKNGESLWGIARQYGSSIAAIEEANGLGERPIQPGQKLTVPIAE
jgi:membrane-bound lytic murein transglycosylase D